MPLPSTLGERVLFLSFAGWESQEWDWDQSAVGLERDSYRFSGFEPQTTLEAAESGLEGCHQKRS